MHCHDIHGSLRVKSAVVERYVIYVQGNKKRWVTLDSPNRDDYREIFLFSSIVFLTEIDGQLPLPFVDLREEYLGVSQQLFFSLVCCQNFFKV
jgi:hypothetical protein